jgi:hypothetical protein
MTIRDQLRWGGILVILVAALVSGTNILVYAGYHNAAIQAVYGVGFTGLVLACTAIHVAQARRAGWLGLLAYLVSVLSLAYSNVLTFLTLAELAGFQAAHAASVAAWETLPIGRLAVYGCYLGLILLGVAVARAGVFPTWAGVLLALGVALQLPAQFAHEIAGPMFYFSASGAQFFWAQAYSG